MTADQRAAYKTRADRVQEIVRDVEALERHQRDLSVALKLVSGVSGLVLWSDGLLNRALIRGCESLIAELEQQSADLGAGLVREKPERNEPAPAIRTAPCPYCNSPLRVSDEPYPVRRLSAAELEELDDDCGCISCDMESRLNRQRGELPCDLGDLADAMPAKLEVET